MYKVNRVNLDWSLSHSEHLNSIDELNTWMYQVQDVHSTVQVVSETSGNQAQLTFNGEAWERLNHNPC